MLSNLFEWSLDLLGKFVWFKEPLDPFWDEDNEDD